MTYSTLLCLMERVLSLSCTPIFPLQPSHTPPLCCSAGRNATSSPPARLAPSPEGTETRLDTTAKRAISPPKLRDRVPRRQDQTSRRNGQGTNVDAKSIGYDLPSSSNRSKRSK